MEHYGRAIAEHPDKGKHDFGHNPGSRAPIRGLALLATNLQTAEISER